MAWGVEHMRPKHHYLWHNARHLSEGGQPMDCFVHERKHQMAKQARAFVRWLSLHMPPEGYGRTSIMCEYNLRVSMRWASA